VGTGLPDKAAYPADEMQIPEMKLLKRKEWSKFYCVYLEHITLPAHPDRIIDVNMAIAQAYYFVAVYKSGFIGGLAAACHGVY
jgi:hypothetical protein